MIAVKVICIKEWMTTLLDSVLFLKLIWWVQSKWMIYMLWSLKILDMCCVWPAATVSSVWRKSLSQWASPHTPPPQKPDYTLNVVLVCLMSMDIHVFNTVWMCCGYIVRSWFNPYFQSYIMLQSWMFILNVAKVSNNEVNVCRSNLCGQKAPASDYS